ncbi:MAG: response regulator [Phycisphaerales bacterium]
MASCRTWCSGHASLRNAGRARSKKPSLIILDLMLPDMNGLEACKRLKADPAAQLVPVVMLTAKGEESDIVAELELGADDYITKPFSDKVLVARVHGVGYRFKD